MLLIHHGYSPLQKRFFSERAKHSVRESNDLHWNAQSIHCHEWKTYFAVFAARRWIAPWQMPSRTKKGVVYTKASAPDISDSITGKTGIFDVLLWNVWVWKYRCIPRFYYIPIVTTVSKSQQLILDAPWIENDANFFPFFFMFEYSPKRLFQHITDAQIFLTRMIFQTTILLTNTIFFVKIKQ